MNFDRRAVSAPTRELANWIAGLRHADLPQRTREVVRIAMLGWRGALRTNWRGRLGRYPWRRPALHWAR